MKNDEISFELSAIVFAVFSLWPRLSTCCMMLLYTTLCVAENSTLQARHNMEVLVKENTRGYLSSTCRCTSRIAAGISLSRERQMASLVLCVAVAICWVIRNISWPLCSFPATIFTLHTLQNAKSFPLFLLITNLLVFVTASIFL